MGNANAPAEEEAIGSMMWGETLNKMVHDHFVILLLFCWFQSHIISLHRASECNTYNGEFTFTSIERLILVILFASRLPCNVRFFALWQNAVPFSLSLSQPIHTPHRRHLTCNDVWESNTWCVYKNMLFSHIKV